jgi:hypothetical protein
MPTDISLEKVEYSIIHWMNNNVQQHQNEVHKMQGSMWTQAKTMAERKTIETETGARFSKLFKCPYFMPIDMAVVDPMRHI